ncbi:unnamed protein product [Amoebophrya sp. A120]|nr:unnamed protein product [Amoebophrya sp. A120]|eukprot:GSA120T00020782001.1
MSAASDRNYGRMIQGAGSSTVEKISKIDDIKISSPAPQSTSLKTAVKGRPPGDDVVLVDPRAAILEGAPRPTGSSFTTTPGAACSPADHDFQMENKLQQDKDWYLHNKLENWLNISTTTTSATPTASTCSGSGSCALSGNFLSEEGTGTTTTISSAAGPPGGNPPPDVDLLQCFLSSATPYDNQHNYCSATPVGGSCSGEEVIEGTSCKSSCTSGDKGKESDDLPTCSTKTSRAAGVEQELQERGHARPTTTLTYNSSGVYNSAPSTLINKPPKLPILPTTGAALLSPEELFAQQIAPRGEWSRDEHQETNNIKPGSFFAAPEHDPLGSQRKIDGTKDVAITTQSSNTSSTPHVVDTPRGPPVEDHAELLSQPSALALNLDHDTTLLSSPRSAGPCSSFDFESSSGGAEDNWVLKGGNNIGRSSECSSSELQSELDATIQIDQDDPHWAHLLGTTTKSPPVYTSCSSMSSTNPQQLSSQEILTTRSSTSEVTMAGGTRRGVPSTKEEAGTSCTATFGSSTTAGIGNNYMASVIHLADQNNSNTVDFSEMMDADAVKHEHCPIAHDLLSYAPSPIGFGKEKAGLYKSPDGMELGILDDDGGHWFYDQDQVLHGDNGCNLDGEDEVADKGKNISMQKTTTVSGAGKSQNFHNPKGPHQKGGQHEVDVDLYKTDQYYKNYGKNKKGQQHQDQHIIVNTGGKNKRSKNLPVVSKFVLPPEEKENDDAEAAPAMKTVGNNCSNKRQKTASSAKKKKGAVSGSKIASEVDVDKFNFPMDFDEDTRGPVVFNEDKRFDRDRGDENVGSGQFMKEDGQQELQDKIQIVQDTAATTKQGKAGEIDVMKETGPPQLGSENNENCSKKTARTSCEDMNKSVPDIFDHASSGGRKQQQAGNNVNKPRLDNTNMYGEIDYSRFRSSAIPFMPSFGFTARGRMPLSAMNALVNNKHIIRGGQPTTFADLQRLELLEGGAAGCTSTAGGFVPHQAGVLGERGHSNCSTRMSSRGGGPYGGAPAGSCSRVGGMGSMISSHHRGSGMMFVPSAATRGGGHNASSRAGGFLGGGNMKGSGSASTGFGDRGPISTAMSFGNNHGHRGFNPIVSAGGSPHQYLIPPTPHFLQHKCSHYDVLFIPREALPFFMDQKAVQIQHLRQFLDYPHRGGVWLDCASGELTIWIQNRHPRSRRALAVVSHWVSEYAHAFWDYVKFVRMRRPLVMSVNEVWERLGMRGADALVRWAECFPKLDLSPDVWDEVTEMRATSKSSPFPFSGRDSNNYRPRDGTTSTIHEGADGEETDLCAWLRQVGADETTKDVFDDIIVKDIDVHHNKAMTGASAADAITTTSAMNKAPAGQQEGTGLHPGGEDLLTELLGPTGVQLLSYATSSSTTGTSNCASASSSSLVSKEPQDDHAELQMVGGTIGMNTAYSSSSSCSSVYNSKATSDEMFLGSIKGRATGAPGEHLRSKTSTTALMQEIPACSECGSAADSATPCEGTPTTASTSNFAMTPGSAGSSNFPLSLGTTSS